MFNMRKRTSLSMGLVLSLLIVLPPYSMVSLNSQMLAHPVMLSEKIEVSEKTVEAFNETYWQCLTTKRQQWSNGTKVHLSVTITDGGLRRMRMNCTLWLPVEGAAASSSSTETEAESPSVCGSSDLYPWVRDMDNLPFLLKGNNGSHIVTYDHDNNYDYRGYNPGLWFLPFNLTGQQKTHVHIPTDTLTNWINGVHDDVTAIGIAYAIAGGATTIALGVIATFFHIPLLGVPMILSGAATLWGGILWLLGWTKEKWIRDTVVENQDGDGWMWIGPRNVTFKSENGYCPWHSRPSWLNYKTYQVAWTESWGSEGIFPGTPTDYTTEYYETTVERSSFPTHQTFNWLGSANNNWP